MVLPDNLTLLKLEAAGKTHDQIAEEYKVTRQAVTYRFNQLERYKKGPKALLLSILPWDISERPDKKRLSNQVGFEGLRNFLKKRTGQDLSPRGQESLRAFLGHMEAGEVLTLDEELGFVYVERVSDDGNLVIRWPEGEEREKPSPKVVEMLTWRQDEK
ncbi:hypothetical protein OHA61_30805 [Streptomyces sp. NBC_00885]|uniref:hypothetical protein n=1 Tax=Streptomyces sp. NBC_00885 TaxID=2975857 RepID=UPI00386B3DD4|nr:hypothetical protein OHA61_30805 [Streptomyces sp. NBC_00885]